MFLNIIILIIGFIILMKCADLFVDGGSGIAENFKVPKMLIALTIVSFGTSAPEFAVSLKALSVGSGDIVLGNVIGSNILNILLILGICSLIHSLSVKNATVKKELPIAMLSTFAFATLLSDKFFDKNLENSFPRGDGFILVLFFFVFLYYLISMVRRKEEVKEEQSVTLPLSKAIIYTLIGIVGIILGSNLVVESATALAKILGVSERMISLTIIALGTSLPELVTSISATRKKEYDIAIGNVVGSNIFNIGIVVGVPVAIMGGIPHISFQYTDLLVMILSSILLFMFSFNDYKISKKEGIIFLMVFIMYYSFVIVS